MSYTNQRCFLKFIYVFTIGGNLRVQNLSNLNQHQASGFELRKQHNNNLFRDLNLNFSEEPRRFIQENDSTTRCSRGLWRSFTVTWICWVFGLFLCSLLLIQIKITFHLVLCPRNTFFLNFIPFVYSLCVKKIHSFLKTCQKGMERQSSSSLYLLRSCTYTYIISASPLWPLPQDCEIDHCPAEFCRKKSNNWSWFRFFSSIGRHGEEIALKKSLGSGKSEVHHNITL